MPYLFTSFRGNGADGLHLATSDDGYHWTDAGRSFVTPQVGPDRLMRDPFLFADPREGGGYHLLWTTGWNDAGFGYAHSPDLLHWGEQRFCPVMAHESGVMNTWAPEISWDSERDEFLVYWASTIPGRFPGDDRRPDGRNHRLYCATTRDFQTFTPTELFFDPGYTVIDAALLPFQGGYLMVFKDEREERVALRTARALTLRGPWEAISAPFTTVPAEGPTVLPMGDGWLVYYDCYRSGYYGAMRTRDFQHYDDVTAQMRFPAGMRHGNVLTVG